MGLQNTIKLAIDSAFAAAGDLLISVTFSKTESVSYNFASRDKENEVVKSIIVDGIVVSSINDRPEITSNNVKTLIVKKEEVGDITSFDKFSLQGKTYNIGDYSDNGFTYEINIV